MSKIKCINGDQKALVLVLHKKSTGFCNVKELETGDEYPMRSRYLYTPTHLKPNPPRVPYVDPYIRMLQIAKA